jgi:hypothetical protein
MPRFVRTGSPVCEVLNRQRVIEPVPLAERLDCRGIRGRLLAQVRRDRIRHDLREQERDQRDPDSEEDERRGAAQEEANERRRREMREHAPIVTLDIWAIHCVRP